MCSGINVTPAAPVVTRLPGDGERVPALRLRWNVYFNDSSCFRFLPVPVCNRFLVSCSWIIDTLCFLCLFVSCEMILMDTFDSPPPCPACVRALTLVFSLKGERLRIPPNECCPECISMSPDSCRYDGAVYGVSEHIKAAFEVPQMNVWRLDLKGLFCKFLSYASFWT